MSSVHVMTLENQMDLGECSQHNRLFECFCTNCQILICPTCLMFGAHKGHHVDAIPNAVRSLRDHIDQCNKKGLLKEERISSVLLDIRQTKLQCIEMKKRVVDKVEEDFKRIMQTLKARKEFVLQDIDKKFQEQMDLIAEQEKKWEEKQEITIELLSIAKLKEDDNLLLKSRFIIETITSLEEPIDYHEAKVLNLMNNNFEAMKEKVVAELSLDELIRSLGSYMRHNDLLSLQYRC